MDKGESKIKATVGKNVYALGETVEACAEVDNTKCQLDIQNISVSLINQLTLRAEGHCKTFSSTSCHETFPGLGAGEDAVGDKMIRL
jgi:hypothetical protein